MSIPSPSGRRLFATLLALTTLSVAAQPSVHVGGFAALPQGEFSDALGSAGGGLSVGVLYAVPETPLAVGVEGDIALYGYERRTVPLSLTIPDVRVGVTTSNNLAHGLAVARLQVPRGAVRPYADGVVGVAYLFTETRVGDDSHYDDHGSGFSTTNYEDVAMVAGGGAGVLVRLHTGMTEQKRRTEVALDLRLRYLSSGRATYLARGDILRYTDGTIGVDPRRSRTDVLTPSLGVQVTF